MECSLCHSYADDILEDIRGIPNIVRKLDRFNPNFRRNHPPEEPISLCNACLNNIYANEPSQDNAYLQPNISNNDEASVKTNTESLENSVKAQIGQIVSESLNNNDEAIVPSQDLREETIEEIEKRVPPAQVYKILLIKEIKKKAMPQRVKLQKIKEIVNSPNYSEAEQKILMDQVFANLGPVITRKRGRDESDRSNTPIISESLENVNEYISPERPRTQSSPELNPPSIRARRRDEISNREIVNLPDSPINSSSSSSEAEHVVPTKPAAPAPAKKHKTRRSAASESENEGSSHSNMAAPSRPHIPHDQPTVRSVTHKDSVRPPKKTLGA